MRREHCGSADSDSKFQNRNYGIGTTSRIEWWFVVDPSATQLAALELERWPSEDPALCSHPRSPRPLDSFQAEVKAINERLRAERCANVLREELIAARGYTGPMFEKYNTVLRAKTGAAFLEQRCAELCRGNEYTTTIHALSSALVKLGKLTKAQTVYRGMKGARLPSEMLKPDAKNIRGGVEFSFMSTTTNRKVAVEYAGAGVGVVMEMQMGMTDRGAEISWLSMYPGEAEILFGSSTGTLLLLCTT